MSMSREVEIGRWLFLKKMITFMLGILFIVVLEGKIMAARLDQPVNIGQGSQYYSNNNAKGYDPKNGRNNIGTAVNNPNSIGNIIINPNNNIGVDIKSLGSGEKGNKRVKQDVLKKKEKSKAKKHKVEDSQSQANDFKEKEIIKALEKGVISIHDPIVKKKIEENTDIGNTMFGNFRVMSFNVFNQKATAASMQRKVIKNLLKETKLSILSLQAASKEVMEFINDEDVSKVYAVVGDKSPSTNVNMNAEEYRPIYYNKSELSIGIPVFLPGKQPIPPTGTLPTDEETKNDLGIFGTYVIFNHNATERKILYVNVDLFSTSSETVSNQLDYITGFIMSTATEDDLVILGGCIESMDDGVSSKIKQIYDNFINFDLNNQRLSSNTLVKIPKGGKKVQRDFVLTLKEKNVKDKFFKFNYARILSEWSSIADKDIPDQDNKEEENLASIHKDTEKPTVSEAFRFEHYPVHVILTLTHKTKKETQ